VGSRERGLGAEEALVQDQEQLQGRLVDRRTGTSGIHQGHIDNGCIVIARVLPKTYNKFAQINFN